MTKEGIEYNFKRLCVYQGDEPTASAMADASPTDAFGFMRHYTRTMDAYGLGKYNNLLLFTKEDFISFVHYFTGTVRHSDDRYSFSRMAADGYDFVIKQIEKYPIIIIK
jgi:hypothetical protein